MEVILASQAHQVPQVGLPHIAPVTNAIILNTKPDGAKLLDIKEKFLFLKIKKQKKIIGKNTLEALRSGFYWGYLGLINNIILKIEKETKKKFKIIFTGGYADLFKTSIIRSFKIDKNITINGIIEIFRENKKYLI